ncbi:MAG: hypothetical protein RL180_368 [Pseudomonadota bacterium]|jgi:hypothetical protein
MLGHADGCGVVGCGVASESGSGACWGVLPRGVGWARGCGMGFRGVAALTRGCAGGVGACGGGVGAVGRDGAVVSPSSLSKRSQVRSNSLRLSS